MQIVAIRQILGMSQREFAEYFGIPVGTLRNWEQGIAKPPEYVFTMIARCVGRDKMINIETIKFVRMLNELAERSENGIVSFQYATDETRYDKVYYDEKSGRIVLDACLVANHHDIVSFYDSVSKEYTMRVITEEEPYVLVELYSSKEQIVIQNGQWYFV